ncbi:MAG: OmpA family protein [Flammeovirgaceae bacterium]
MKQKNDVELNKKAHILLYFFIGILISGVSPKVPAQTAYFNKLENFPSTHVNCMVVDHQNVKWIGTEHGLIAMHDEDDFQLFTEKNSALRDSQINCITLNERGNKWLGSYSKGLMRLDALGRFQHYPFANSKILLISSIAVNAKQEVFVATTEDGVYQLIDGKLHPKWREKNSKLLSNRVNRLKWITEEHLLIATAKGLCEIRGKQWKNYPKLAHVRDLQELNGNWYASTLTPAGPRLWVRKTKRWETLPHALFNDAFQLKNIVLGNQFIWVTSDRGIIRFDGTQYRLFDLRYGLSHAISCVAVDQQQQVWVGSVNQGVYKKGEKIKSEQPLQATISDNGIQVGEFIRLKHAIFKQSTTELLDSAVYDELQVLLIFLQQNPSLKLEIHGHTDNTGSQLKNWELSRQRTQVIVNYLRSQGLESHRIIGIWHGENQPFLPNTSAANKQQNRRVEIRIITER